MNPLFRNCWRCLWDKLPVNEDDTIANKFNITPDWIIEILSPEQYMGLITKKIIGVASLRDDMQLFSIKKKYLLKAIASNLKKVKIVF